MYKTGFVLKYAFVYYLLELLFVCYSVQALLITLNQLKNLVHVLLDLLDFQE